jgi:hypothetical protein
LPIHPPVIKVGAFLAGLGKINIMIKLEKKCKECGKIEVSEVRILPIFDSNNWICRDCKLKINERINKEREEEERKKEEEYRKSQEEKKKEEEK